MNCWVNVTILIWTTLIIHDGFPLGKLNHFSLPCPKTNQFFLSYEKMKHSCLRFMKVFIDEPDILFPLRNLNPCICLIFGLSGASSFQVPVCHFFLCPMPLPSLSHVWTIVVASAYEYFGHLIRRADSFEKTLMLGKIEGERRKGWQRMRWLDGITNSMDMSLTKSKSKLLSISLVIDREAWHAAVHGETKSWTRLTDWTELILYRI